MLVCFEKKLKKIEEISKILLTILKGFKKKLEVLENFNKMYTIVCMHSIVFIKEKHCTLFVYTTEFFLKSGGGGQMHYCPPPPSKIWGGGARAPWPPCGGPHALTVSWV